MWNTNSSQQMSACGLLTNTAWQWEKAAMEGDLAIGITPYPGVKLPTGQLQACPCWPHRSAPLSPASSISIKKSCTSAHGLEVQGRQDARTALFLTHKTLLQQQAE